MSTNSNQVSPFWPLQPFTPSRATEVSHQPTFRCELRRQSALERTRGRQFRSDLCNQLVFNKHPMGPLTLELKACAPRTIRFTGFSDRMPKHTPFATRFPNSGNPLQATCCPQVVPCLVSRQPTAAALPQTAFAVALFTRAGGPFLVRLTPRLHAASVLFPLLPSGAKHPCSTS